MDLRAVLPRRPQLALVDELAHRKVPGAGHATRWQDIEDLLAAGLDVISTFSIGHLDSLADVAAKITGTAPLRTVPDPVVRAAGEIQPVAIPPEVLRDRIACGYIYPLPEAKAALGGWFQTGNLSALRELALRWLAATLASGPRRLRPGGHARERVVVALSGGPEGETLIRRAARITARSGADLLAVHDAPPRCWRSLTRKCHPAGGRRNPAKLAGRASARNHDQIAGHPPRRRNRRAHRHLLTHRQRRPTRGV